MRIEPRESRRHSLEVKRLAVPFRVLDSCPGCGKECESFESRDHFSYPLLEFPERVDFGCDCGREWHGFVVLSLTAATVVP